MKFQHLALAATFIATAIFFTDCSKEPTSTPSTEGQSGRETTSRGVCKVSVTSIDGCLDVCGTQNNLITCSGNLVGTDFIPNGGKLNMMLTTPTQLVLNRNMSCVTSAIASYATVTTSAGTVNYTVTPGTPVVITIDDNCNVF